MLIETTIKPDGTQENRRVPLEQYGRGKRAKQIILVNLDRSYHIHGRCGFVYSLIFKDRLVFLKGLVDSGEWTELNQNLRRMLPNDQEIVIVR